MTPSVDNMQTSLTLLPVAKSSITQSLCLLERALLLESIIDFTQDDADTDKGDTDTDDCEENRDFPPA
jgi:hypothetical protein